MLISVIVPALNEEENIERCLNSLLDQTASKRDYELIVSDSSSEDNTVKIAKPIADKVVKCKRVGAGFGRNYGVKFAKGKYLAFIDADSFASPRWIEGIAESLKNAVAATGPFSCMENRVKYKIYYNAWNAHTRFSLWMNYPEFPGFNFAVRKSNFVRAGGFPADSVVDDIMLSQKLNQYGRLAYNKKMQVKTSGRRLDELGVLNYALRGWTYTLFKKQYKWESHRRDFKK